MICLKHGLPSPLSLLQDSPPISKVEWSSLIKARVTLWHEQELRRISTMNFKMKYLNVQLIGLSGQPHPVLHDIVTTKDAKKTLPTPEIHHLWIYLQRAAIQQPTDHQCCMPGLQQQAWLHQACHGQLQGPVRVQEQALSGADEHCLECSANMSTPPAPSSTLDTDSIHPWLYLTESAWVLHNPSP